MSPEKKKGEETATEPMTAGGWPRSGI